MSVSPELMKAILAMDAYNRGYDQGIIYEGNAIGTATVTQQSDIDPDGAAVAAGFYAAAYQWNGETIISYRGTNADSPEALLTDVWNGWAACIGFSDASQAGLAIQFYEVVTGKGLYDGAADNTTLIGHSLGGGLAGFVSALSNTPGVGFDHMPFGLAAWAQYASDFSEANLPSFDQFQGVYVEGEILELGRNGVLQFGVAALLAGFAGAGIIPAALLIPLVAATGIGTAGLELLVDKEELPVEGSYNLLDLIHRANMHSQALLPILQFSKDEGHTDWRAIEMEMFSSFFDDDIGEKAGFLGEDEGGVSDFAQKMLTAIAYSAIDEGTLVFGNTGIRAMFDDANKLGELKANGQVPTAHADPIPGLAEAIVQFAGQMALNKLDYVNQGQGLSPEEGFLSTYDSNGRDFLFADLNKALWNLGGPDPNQDLDIKGIQTILDSFFSNEAQGAEGQASEMLAAMQELYGSEKTSTIERIDFALGTRWGMNERLAA